MALAMRFLVLVIVVLVIGTSVGCSRGVNYPKAKVTSPLNRPGTCVACKKKIESVADANLVVIEGVQYVICDDKCVTTLRKQLEWDKGR